MFNFDNRSRFHSSWLRFRVGIVLLVEGERVFELSCLVCLLYLSPKFGSKE